jgi:hypothetical protein
MELFETARGKFVTPAGDVSVAWNKEALEVEVSADLEAEVVIGESVSVQRFENGRQVVFARK